MDEKRLKRIELPSWFILVASVAIYTSSGLVWAMSYFESKEHSKEQIDETRQQVVEIKALMIEMNKKLDRALDY